MGDMRIPNGLGWIGRPGEASTMCVNSKVGASNEVVAGCSGGEGEQLEVSPALALAEGPAQSTDMKLFDGEPYTYNNLQELVHKAALFMDASADFTSEVVQLVMVVKKLVEKLGERVGEAAVESIGARAWTIELSQELSMNQASVARIAEYMRLGLLLARSRMTATSGDTLASHPLEYMTDLISFTGLHLDAHQEKLMVIACASDVVAPSVLANLVSDFKQFVGRICQPLFAKHSDSFVRRSLQLILKGRPVCTPNMLHPKVVQSKAPHE